MTLSEVQKEIDSQIRATRDAERHTWELYDAGVCDVALSVLSELNKAREAYVYAQAILKETVTASDEKKPVDRLSE